MYVVEKKKPKPLQVFSFLAYFFVCNTNTNNNGGKQNPLSHFLLSFAKQDMKNKWWSIHVSGKETIACEQLEHYNVF